MQQLYSTCVRTALDQASSAPVICSCLPAIRNLQLLQQLRQSLTLDHFYYMAKYQSDARMSPPSRARRQIRNCKTANACLRIP